MDKIYIPNNMSSGFKCFIRKEDSNLEDRYNQIIKHFKLISNLWKDYKMELKIINQDFSICKVEDLSQIDYSDKFCFVSKTDEELSLVCNTNLVPQNAIVCDNGWKAFRIQGVLDFSLIGIMSRISTLLAENKIGIFAISTYNTDYILTKEENFDKSIKILESNGYIIKL